MMEIYFEINGKRVDPKKLSNVLEKAMFEGVKKHVKRKLQNVRCSKHSSGAKIVCKGPDLEHLKFEISGCCKEFMGVIKDKLGSGRAL